MGSCLINKNPLELNGVVLDADGLPDEGAIVCIKKTNICTITNEKGEFSLAAKLKSTLEIKPSNGDSIYEIKVKTQKLKNIHPPWDCFP